MTGSRTALCCLLLGALASACGPKDSTVDWDGELEDADACFHREIPQATGEPAVVGTTEFASADERAPCAPAAGPDLRYLWRPDETRSYRIHTNGTGFDTVLTVYRGCNRQRVACNDDHHDLQSQVVIEAEAFVDYVIVVDGYERRDSGPFQLTIQ